MTGHTKVDHRRREFLSLFVATSALALTGGPAATRQEIKLPIGMNLSGIADWEPGFPFRNLMWGARVWHTRNASGHGPWQTSRIDDLPIDENGYPLEVPFQSAGMAEQQIVFTILPNTLRPGSYVLLYDGEGKFKASGGTKILKSTPGRLVLRMTHQGDDLTEQIEIHESVRGNHIRNVRIVPIEDEKVDPSTDPFRPEVIEFCKPWHALRFMDWLSTNHNLNVRWDDRARRSFYTQVGVGSDDWNSYGLVEPAWKKQWASGVEIELCIELANKTGKAAWFCVPHLADDDYIRQFATLVKSQLDPALDVYVEFSNELWNRIFFQSHWAARSVLAAELVAKTTGKHPWLNGAQPTDIKHGIAAPRTHEGTHLPERIGALFRRCYSIWEDVFDGPHRKRLKRVCAVQMDWPEMAGRTAQWVHANGGFDVLAPAGYFGPDEDIYARWKAKGASLSVHDVAADMRIALRSHGRALQQISALAKRTGTQLATYEGGQHIQPENQVESSYSKALSAIQTDPAMYDLYRELLAQHSAADCTLFSAFASIGRQGSQYGSWGHLSHYGQPASEMPKFRALLDSNAKIPQR